MWWPVLCVNLTRIQWVGSQSNTYKYVCSYFVAIININHKLILSKGDYAWYLGSPNSICQNTLWEEPRFKEKKNVQVPFPRWPVQQIWDWASKHHNRISQLLAINPLICISYSLYFFSWILIENAYFVNWRS